MKTLDVGLKLLDEAIGEGRFILDPDWVMNELGTTPKATDRVLSQLLRQGLVDRVARGKYAIRQIGVLGTSAAAEDVALAVAALFEGIPHRLSYKSALDYHGLLTRPVQSIQVASSVRVRRTMISDRPLQVVMEIERTIGIGAHETSWGAHVSDIERSILDAAIRPDLTDGIGALVESLALSNDVDALRLAEYANSLEANSALRRVGAISDLIGLSSLGKELRSLSEPKYVVDLDPSAERRLAGPVDKVWKIRWNIDPDELLQVANQ